MPNTNLQLMSSSKLDSESMILFITLQMYIHSLAVPTAPSLSEGIILAYSFADEEAATLSVKHCPLSVCKQESPRVFQSNEIYGVWLTNLSRLNNELGRGNFIVKEDVVHPAMVRLGLGCLT